MGLTADDREWISGEFARQLSKVQSVSTDDEAADGNPNTYTITGGIGRAIRLASFTATGQTLKPHD
jgi:hypothetical protein